MTRYHKSTRDFIYPLINIEIIKAFISSNKIKSVDDEGVPSTFYGWDHLRKHHNSILYGAGRSKSELPRGYRMQMKSFLDSLKKENQQKKKLGQVDEQEADPITMPFYKEIVKWCVNKGHIFLWVFTVLQWNCMARSCNIDGLTWNSFKVGKDSVEIKFWDTKKDKEGKKCSPKNCYANPYNFHICTFTALACFFVIFDKKFENERNAIFLTKGTKKGTRSSSCCGISFKKWEILFSPGSAQATARIMGSGKVQAFNAQQVRRPLYPLQLLLEEESGPLAKCLTFIGFLLGLETTTAADFLQV